MEEEELCAGPIGVLLADNGGCACFLVSRLEVTADGGVGVVECVEVEDARGVHDEGRPAEKLVRPMLVDPALHVQLYKQDGINE